MANEGKARIRPGGEIALDLKLVVGRCVDRVVAFHANVRTDARIFSPTMARAFIPPIRM
jgi:hypothetical protein